MRPKAPASRRVGPEMARSRRYRSSTTLPPESLRRSAQRPGHFRRNARSIVSRQSLGLHYTKGCDSQLESFWNVVRIAKINQGEALISPV
jgi:hypothetical protein